MPWKETCVMDQKIQFIADWLGGDYSKSALCEAYGISRPTGDKWIRRYRQEGASGLKEHSRAPHQHPNQTPEWLQQEIIQMKLAHQNWGPKKVIDRLRVLQPESPWPADSTAGELLKRAGLVKERKHRRHVAPYSEPFAECTQSNHTWSTDFKGDFLLGDGRRCYPLTISDNFSRYLFECRGLYHPRYSAVRPWFEWVFREYGLPDAMRTDNGAPFASMAAGGISQLSKWWIRLGIRPERIQPGKPAQNGRHERMHRTLKEATAKPAKQNMNAQQRAFNRFKKEYNDERSHESLGRRTPARVYQASLRSYPTKLPVVEYDSDQIVRQVRQKGEIRWKGSLIYVSEVLAKEPIGLKQIDHDTWVLYYSFYALGHLDERSKKVIPVEGWHNRRQNV